MSYSAAADIICLLRHLVEAMRPFAGAKRIELSYQPDRVAYIVEHCPETVAGVFTSLLCRIIAFMPECHCVVIRPTVTEEAGGPCLDLTITNSGINLVRVKEITSGCRQAIEVAGGSAAVAAAGSGIVETSFHLQWRFPRYAPGQGPNGETTDVRSWETGDKPNREATYLGRVLPAFYSEIRKRLQSHFNRSDALVAALALRHPKEAAFLREVNTMIEANLHEEGFDVARLSMRMNMSRVQLYRRLKPLIRQAPAAYIKLLRLQKARELLETTGLRIGEIAFRTGFQSASHFTRTFTQHYGVRPSLFIRSKYYPEQSGGNEPHKRPKADVTKE